MGISGKHYIIAISAMIFGMFLGILGMYIKEFTELPDYGSNFCDYTEDIKIDICPALRSTNKINNDSGYITIYICNDISGYIETYNLDDASKKELNEKIKDFKENGLVIEKICKNGEKTAYRIKKDG